MRQTPTVSIVNTSHTRDAVRNVRQDTLDYIRCLAVNLAQSKPSYSHLSAFMAIKLSIRPLALLVSEMLKSRKIRRNF